MVVENVSHTIAFFILINERRKRMVEDGELITVDEMAEMLKVPRSWIYSRTRIKGAGAIPRVQCGKYIRFHPKEVLEWLRRAQGTTQVI
jgi:excisionase family DNA binding protein